MNRSGIQIKIDIIFCIMLVLIFIEYTLSMLHPMRINAILQTYTTKALIILLIAYFFYMISRFERIFLKKNILIAGIVFLILYLLSIYYENSSGVMNENIGTGIYKMAFPLIIAIGMINFVDKEYIYNTMVAILIISIVGYIFELAFAGKVNIASIMAISIIDSYSPFESNFFSGLSISLGAYFSYYRKDKKWTILALIFSLMTFKRIPIIFAIILFVLPCIKKDLNIKHSVKTTIIMTLGFTLLGVAYANLVMPQNSILIDSFTLKYFGIPFTKAVMGRNVLLDQLMASGYVRSGLDSTFLFAQDIEMDLVRIYLEVGAIGVLTTVYYYWSFSTSNLYAFIYMMSIMINFLFSHSIHSPFGWILKCILFMCIAKESEVEKLNKQGVE